MCLLEIATATATATAAEIAAEIATATATVFVLSAVATGMTVARMARLLEIAATAAVRDLLAGVVAETASFHRKTAATGGRRFPNRANRAGSTCGCPHRASAGQRGLGARALGRGHARAAHQRHTPRSRRCTLVPTCVAACWVGQKRRLDPIVLAGWRVSAEHMRCNAHAPAPQPHPRTLAAQHTLRALRAILGRRCVVL